MAVIIVTSRSAGVGKMYWPFEVASHDRGGGFGPPFGVGATLTLPHSQATPRGVLRAPVSPHDGGMGAQPMRQPRCVPRGMSALPRRKEKLLLHRPTAPQAAEWQGEPHRSLTRSEPTGAEATLARSTALPTVLYVDDDRRALDLMAAQLGREFTVTTAENGAAGLKAVENDGPFSVVISDLQMIGMNGNVFLSKVRQIDPDAVRLLLTGHADLSAAMGALNEGQVFKLLTKPCTRGMILTAVHAANTQHEVLLERRALLERTLQGCRVEECHQATAADPGEGSNRRRRLSYRGLRQMLGSIVPPGPNDPSLGTMKQNFAVHSVPAYPRRTRGAGHLVSRLLSP